MRKWEKVEIGKHIDQIRGVSYGGDDSIEDPRDEYLPILRSNNIGEGELNLNDLVYVHKRFVKDVQKLREGDILITASTGSKQAIGKNGYVTKDYDGGFGAFCKVVRAKETIDKSYLKHFFQSPKYRETIRHVINGANINNIKNEHIDKQKIPLPPLPIQRQIAEVLDTADALRRSTQEQLAALDELAQGVFLEMFGDPVRNEKGWEMKPLGPLASKFSDGPFGSNLKTSHYTENGVRVIRLNNIGIGYFNDTNQSYISKNHYEKVLKKHTCLKGDVIIATLGDPILRACEFPSHLSFAINKADCLQFRPKTNLILPLYLISLINSIGFQALAKNLVHGQTRGRINKGQLSQFVIPLPPIELQTQFAAIIANIEAQKAVLRESLAESEALFGGLLQRVFG